jgi:hypothetical protein
LLIPFVLYDDPLHFSAELLYTPKRLINASNLLLTYSTCAGFLRLILSCGSAFYMVAKRSNVSKQVGREI